MIARAPRGFTLIELLVVIAIIGILSSVVLASLNAARAKARDAARITQVQQIAKAIELYYLDNGYYPRIQHGMGQEGSCGSQTENWGHCDRLKQLADNLAPYMSIVPETLSNATQGSYYYSYASQSGDGWQSYGLMVFLEGSGGANDGGYYSGAIEVGNNPPYCTSKYTGSSSNWLQKSGGYEQRCAGGN